MANPLWEIVRKEDLMLEVGRIVSARYMEKALDFPPGRDQEYATNWLKAMGFTNVEWAQLNDFTLLCFLEYTESGELRATEFILEFSGNEAPITVSLWLPHRREVSS